MTSREVGAAPAAPALDEGCDVLVGPAAARLDALEWRWRGRISALERLREYWFDQAYTTGADPNEGRDAASYGDWISHAPEWLHRHRHNPWHRAWLALRLIGEACKRLDEECGGEDPWVYTSACEEWAPRGWWGSGEVERYARQAREVKRGKGGAAKLPAVARAQSRLMRSWAQADVGELCALWLDGWTVYERRVYQVNACGGSLERHEYRLSPGSEPGAARGADAACPVEAVEVKLGRHGEGQLAMVFS